MEKQSITYEDLLLANDGFHVVNNGVRFSISRDRLLISGEHEVTKDVRSRIVNDLTILKAFVKANIDQLNIPEEKLAEAYDEYEEFVEILKHNNKTIVMTSTTATYRIVDKCVFKFSEDGEIEPLDLDEVKHLLGTYNYKLDIPDEIAIKRIYRELI